MTLPTGPAVVFLFTDIEGSTRLERSVGSVPWAGVAGRHDQLLRAEVESRGGVVVKTEGDAFFAAFDTSTPAITAAVAAQRAIATESWASGLALKVRMGIHLGEGRLRSGRGTGEPEDYVGIDVNYAARISAAANGGQIVLSDALVGTLPRELARLPGMNDVASIVMLSDGDPQMGARVAGATYRVVRDKGVMLAPVKVLHLPDPAGLAGERLWADRATLLLAEGEATPLEEVISLVLAAPPPCG